jgi:hypothetical protein
MPGVVESSRMNETNSTAREGESQLSAANAEATTLEGFHWLPGMRGAVLAGDGSFLFRVVEGGYVIDGLGLRPPRFVAGEPPPAWAEPLWDDPATGGALLTLLGTEVQVVISERAEGSLWRLAYPGPDGRRRLSRGRRSLGEACAQAARTMDRWPGGGAR